MPSCNEFSFDNLSEIIALPLDAYTPGEEMLLPVIPERFFNPAIGERTIVIGHTTNIEGATAGALVYLISGTGEVKDSESLQVAGRLHTVSVGCKVDDRDPDVLTFLQRLEDVPHHLILTSRNGERAFVYATEFTYMCTTERDKGSTSLQFVINNMKGMQAIKGKISPNTDYQYDIYIGMGGADIYSEAGIQSLTNVQHIEANAIGGSYSISIPSISYLWICVNASIGRVMSNGFRVPMENAVTVGDYQCYRSGNSIRPHIMQFTIEGN